MSDKIKTSSLFTNKVELHPEVKAVLEPHNYDEEFKSHIKEVTSSHDVPVLEFEEGFLSWFRGYRMQVSMTLEGVGNKGASPTGMNYEINNASDSLKVTDEYLVNLIYLKHAIIALDGYPKMQKYLFENQSVLAEFIAQTASFQGQGSDTPDWLEKFKNLIETVPTSELSGVVPQYLIVDKYNTYSIGTAYVNNDLFGVYLDGLNEAFIIKNTMGLDLTDKYNADLVNTILRSLLFVKGVIAANGGQIYSITEDQLVVTILEGILGKPITIVLHRAGFGEEFVLNSK